jgi:hypothetical protein
MSCSIATGKGILCQNDVGGIDKMLLISGIDADRLSSVTVTTGVATAVATASATVGTWFDIDLDKYQSNFNQTIVTSESGVAYQQDLEIVCRGVQATTIDLFEDIVAGIWQIMVRDNNGVYYLLDFTKMARCTGGSFIHNGDKALSDPIGFTLQFSAMGTSPAINMGTDPTSITASKIQISATQI